jgi:hypothetical protein
MIDPRPRFPTPQHEQVARIAADYFRPLAQVDTVLVVNSCARGVATPESDLDMAILAQPAVPPHEQREMEARWQAYAETQPLVREFKTHSHFSAVHLDVIDGCYSPAVWDDGGGPDDFEISIGNQVAHSALLGEVGPYFRRLQSEWLPYYGEDLRHARCDMVRDACAYDLEFVPFYVRRGLYFQAFDRLYKAFREFLQGLFIARRTYPVAYNKWIRDQVENWLGLPELYRQLPPILSVSDIASDELIRKAQALRALRDTWVTTG